jgi:hypothetical protein
MGLQYLSDILLELQAFFIEHPVDVGVDEQRLFSVRVMNGSGIK